MTTNSQLLTTTPKTKTKQTKQTTRTGTHSQKQRSHGGLSVRKGKEENEGKDTGDKKHKWQVQNKQGEIKDSIGNGEAKELICKTHGHELRGAGVGECWWVVQGGGGEKGEKNGTTVIA